CCRCWSYLGDDDAQHPCSRPAGSGRGCRGGGACHGLSAAYGSGLQRVLINAGYPVWIGRAEPQAPPFLLPTPLSPEESSAMRLVLIALALLLWAPGLARADDLACVSTTFKLLSPNDKVCVSEFDDPKVPGVTCHISQARKGGW